MNKIEPAHGLHCKPIKHLVWAHHLPILFQILNRGYGLKRVIDSGLMGNWFLASSAEQCSYVEVELLELMTVSSINILSIFQFYSIFNVAHWISLTVWYVLKSKVNDGFIPTITIYISTRSGSHCSLLLVLEKLLFFERGMPATHTLLYFSPFLWSDLRI